MFQFFKAPTACFSWEGCFCWRPLGAALAMLGAMLGKLTLLLLGLQRIGLSLPDLPPRRGDIDSIFRLLRGAPVPSPTD